MNSKLEAHVYLLVASLLLQLYPLTEHDVGNRMTKYPSLLYHPVPLRMPPNEVLATAPVYAPLTPDSPLVPEVLERLLEE